MFGWAFGQGEGAQGGGGVGGGSFPFFGGTPLGAGARMMGASFQRSYRAYSFAMHPSGNAVDHEKGDKVFLPASALEELIRRNIDYPMLFQLRNEQLKRNTHCGVLEFSAEEGRIYMPHWMMENLLLQEGSVVTVENKSLPKATYTKLQPQENAFIKVSNPKAILEHALRRFSCLTKGNQFTIIYNNNKYNIKVCDLKPANACSIIETDCQVDFEAPPNWAQEEARLKNEQAAAALAKAKASDAAGAAGAAAGEAGAAASSSSAKGTAAGSTKGGNKVGKRKAGESPDKSGEKPEKIGTLDLAKLAAERAERRRQLTSPNVKAFSGTGRRVDGRTLKASQQPPPPAPQAPSLSTLGAPKPGAATGRSSALKKFRKRKETSSFAGLGNKLA